MWRQSGAGSSFREAQEAVRRMPVGHRLREPFAS